MKTANFLIYFCAVALTIFQILDTVHGVVPAEKADTEKADAEIRPLLRVKRVKRVMGDPVAQLQYQQYPPQTNYPQPHPGYPQQNPQPGYQPPPAYPPQQHQLGFQQPTHVHNQPTSGTSGPFDGMACLHTNECSAPNTVLTCEKGRCICPNKPQLSYTRGKHPLNTIWDNGVKKCLSVKDSACDVYFPKSVYCQQGLGCKPDGHGFGHCSASYKGSAHAIVAQMTGTILMTFLARILY